MVPNWYKNLILLNLTCSIEYTQTSISQKIFPYVMSSMFLKNWYKCIEEYTYFLYEFKEQMGAELRQ